MSLNGIVLINKARGVSSNKVVNKVKYLLKAEKAGHLGTLDVLGEGLLPVTLGKGTKVFEYFLNKDKVYHTVFKFGETTATLDLEGEIIQKNNVVVTLDNLKSVAKSFIGKQMQMPPAYSAKKVNGHKAYELIRKGEEFSLKPKEVEIYSIEIINELETNVFELIVHCSSGTYIRSLCRDLANSLSTYGVMLSIQRTKCGKFDIFNSNTLEDVENGIFTIVQLDTIFDNEKLILKKEDCLKLLNGQIINVNASNGEYRVYDNQLFLGLGQVENSKLKLSLRLI